MSQHSLGRAMPRKGGSHASFSRGGTSSMGSPRDSMVAGLTPNLYWIAATLALQQSLGRANRPTCTARSFLDLRSHDRTSPPSPEAFSRRPLQGAAKGTTSSFVVASPHGRRDDPNPTKSLANILKWTR